MDDSEPGTIADPAGVGGFREVVVGFTITEAELIIFNTEGDTEEDILEPSNDDSDDESDEEDEEDDDDPEDEDDDEDEEDELDDDV